MSLEIAWYICGNKRMFKAGFPNPNNKSLGGAYLNYPAIFDFKKTIEDEGGKVALTEVLGKKYICKVKAETKTLEKLDAEYRRLPSADLKSNLSSLTVAQKNSLKDEIVSMGYSSAKITETLSADIGNNTLETVLKFMASERRKAVWHEDTKTFTYDGALQPVKSIDTVDKEVK